MDLTIQAQENQMCEEYTLSFYTAFHKSLKLTLRIKDEYSDILIIEQDAHVFVADAMTYQGKLVGGLTQIERFPDLKNFVKPNFYHTESLNNEDSKKLRRLFVKIDSASTYCINDDLSDEDAMLIEFVSKSGNTTKTNDYYDQSTFTELKATFLEILTFIETNPSGIIVKTAENIKTEFSRKFNYKIISESPLIVKILDSNPPFCPNIRNFIETLPIADDICIDISNYSGETTNCILKIFKEKYKHIRWIINEEDYIEKGIMYLEK